VGANRQMPSGKMTFAERRLPVTNALMLVSIPINQIVATMRTLKGLTGIVAFSILFSCNSKDPEPSAKACKPVSIHSTHSTNFDSVQYAYSTSGKLDKLLYYQGGKAYETNQLEYNAQGKLLRVTRKYEFQEKPFNTFEFAYREGRIDKMYLWADTSVPPMEITFTYDTKGRLSTRTDDFYETRYAYTDDGNVEKIFYTSTHYGSESLGKENHSFDTHERFFASVPELATLNIYIFRYEPSKNNVTSTKIYMPDAGTTFGTPHEISLALKYDSNDMLTSNYVDYWLVEGLTEVNFKKVRYSCQ
jgi:hypothetical protein